jgi:hypothetical protein
MFRRLLVCFVVAACAAVPARAGNLVLTYHGSTVFSSDPSNNPIPDGTPFEIQAVFSGVPYGHPGTGSAGFTPLSITATVGSTSYEATSAYLSNYLVEIFDPTNADYPGSYVPVVIDTVTGLGFEPEYATATPPILAASPSPTVFSGYKSAPPQGNGLVLPADGGLLSLGFDPSVGVSAPISAVPEPAGLTLALLGGAGGVSLLRRRRVAAA